jgi:hypothetical protein
VCNKDLAKLLLKIIKIVAVGSATQ